jgi:hypothetical protein
MAVAIDEMNVEVAPIAPAAPAHGGESGAGAASPLGQPDSAALHKMMLVLHERKLRLKTN